MSSEINVVSKTQVIVVEPYSRAVSIINAGPVGPQGAPGTIVHVGPTAPPTPSVNDLWVDTS
jgi:hypothetical protein